MPHAAVAGKIFYDDELARGDEHCRDMIFRRRRLCGGRDDIAHARALQATLLAGRRMPRRRHGAHTMIPPAWA